MKQYYRILEKIAPYAIILVSGIIAYRKVIFSTGPAVETNDISILFYPIYFFVKKAFVSGQIPFWDPHQVFGQPLLFNLGLGILYPPFLFLMYFSSSAFLIPRHLELFIVFHLILSGITMYWGLRKIGINRPGASLGGVIFQLFIGNRELIVWPPMAFGLPWVPLAVFYFFYIISAEDKPKILKDTFILILSYFMIISTTHPHLIAYTYFQTFLISFFFIIYRLYHKNLHGVFNCLKKTLFYPIVPLFLAAFIILPMVNYLPYTTRWMPVESYRNIGPLYRSYLATIILPVLTWQFSSPYAYTGLLTLLLACGYCLFVKREDRARYNFYWVILAIFWILFSIQDSPLYPIILKHVPFMQSMRFSNRGMIFYTLSVCPLAGKFFDNLCYNLQPRRLQTSIFLIFPISLLLLLIFTGKDFIELIKNHPLELDYRLWILLGSVVLFSLSLFIHNKTIKILIPIWLIIELLSITFKSPFINYSKEDPYYPYDAIWHDYEQKYPEIYNNELGLYKIENYDEPLIVPYYFNTYSVHGYLSQATHPRRYYYLWHEHGGWFSYRHLRFWDLAYLPFYSPIYDLMGVRYFIAKDGTEALPLAREIRGQGEWVSGILLTKIIGAEFGFTEEEVKNWSFNTEKTSYNYSINEKEILLLSLYLDGDSQKDEFIKISRHGINIDLKKYPEMELDYMVEDPNIQIIEIVLGIDFNNDRIVDKHIRGIYQHPAPIGLDKFNYNILTRIREEYPDKENYALIELELYPHKLWGIDCKSPGRNRDYRFHVKNLKIFGYSHGKSNINKIRLYNTIDDSHRRMTKGHLDLDSKSALSFEMPIEPGWHEFSFEPIQAKKFRLTIDEVKPQRWDGTDGVMVGEMELYNTEGEKIKIDPPSLKASSTFWTNYEKCLIDGDTESPWQSGCRIALKEMMERDTVKEIRRGVFINTNVLPRAFMVRKIKVLNNIDELAKELHASNFTPSRVLLLEDNPKDQIEIEHGEPDDKIEITRYSLNKIEITADIKTSGYLVLTDTYLPGWHAYVNGNRREILRAYGYFRAIALDKGFNKIIFTYFPPMLKFGIILSLITLLTLAILVRKHIYDAW